MPDSPLLATLKRLNPAAVRAYAGDDGYRDIAVPKRRRRWEQVVTAIEAEAWTKCEARDSKGAVLGYVENDSTPTDLVALGDGKTPSVREAQQIARLVVDTSRSLTMDFVKSRDAEVTALLRAQGEVMREMCSATRELAMMYREQVQVAGDVAAAREQAKQAAEAAAAGGGEWKELMEALPTIVQALPMLKALLSSGTPSPVNGVSSKAKG